MLSKKHITISSLAIASVLVGSLFYYNITRAQETREYDPWVDINDDGQINILDIFEVAKRFGTSGEPINKAALTYDSGWVDITDKCGQYFNITHNLNITNPNNPDIIFDITGKTTLDSQPLLRLGLTEHFWSQTYGGTHHDVAWDVVETGDGGYALAGYTESFGAGGYDAWLVKTDSLGNMEWNKTYGGTHHDVAYGMVETGDGGYALAGETNSFGAGGEDVWLVKIKRESESGLVWTGFTADSIILYRDVTDVCWNYVRVCIWKIRETP